MSDAREFDNGLLQGCGPEPEAVQPQGWLIVCDARAVRITRHSDNLSSLFPGRQGENPPFIGSKLTELLGSETAHGLRNCLARFAGPARPALLPNCVFPGCDGVFDVTTCQSGDETLVEIEKADPNADRLALDRTRAMVDRIASATDPGRLMQAATRLVFSVLQYDRADIVRFQADGTVELVVQQHSHDLEPAEQSPEFPELSRARLRDERMRLIADANAAPAAIVSEPDAGPLDLTFGHLRAASKGERDALQRDGFTSSLSVALIVDDDLWGAILFRDRAPRNPSMDMRASTEIFADFLALRLQVLLQKQAMDER